jgi:hypothetical protein
MRVKSTSAARNAFAAQRQLAAAVGTAHVDGSVLNWT